MNVTNNPTPSANAPRDPAPSGGPGRAATRRELNVRLLLVSVGLLAALGVSAYFWRDHQVKRLADSLLDRVSQLENEKQWAMAVAYLQQYLTLNPENNEVRVRAAKVYDHDLKDGRQYQRAAQLYYSALGAAPEDISLRKRLAELLHQSNRHAEAVTEAEKLLDAKDGDAKFTGQRIIALVAADETNTRDSVDVLNDAYDKLDKANAARPGDAEVAARLALLYRMHGDKLTLSKDDAGKKPNDLADEVIERMVAAGPDQAESYLTRARYRQAFNLPGVREDIEQALKLGPKDPGVLFAAGNHFLSVKPIDAKRARQLFEQLVEAAPTAELGYVGLGRAHKALGSTSSAIAAWNRGQERLGGTSDLISRELFAAYLEEGNRKGARDTLDRLRDLWDKRLPYETTDLQIRVRFNLARLEAQWLLANNEPGRVPPLLLSAIATSGSLGTAPARNPDLLPCRELLARAYSALESWDLAAAEYSELVERSESPWKLAQLAADAWKRAGAHDRAIQYYQRAARNTDAPAQVWLGLAQAQLEQQLLTPAAENRDWKAFRQTLSAAKQAMPSSWPVRILEVDYLLAQQNEADRDAAEALLRAGEKEHAAEPAYWQRLVFAYERLKRTADADRALQAYLELEPNPIESALVRVNLMAARKQFAEAEKLLAETLTTAPEQLRRPLRYRQMQLALEAGDVTVGRQRLAALRAEDPSNLRLLRRSAELAFEARDWKALAELDEPLRKAEGDAGHAWRFYRAAQLLADPAHRTKQDLAEAEKLVAAILADRPRWTPATVLSGQLAEARGDIAGATASYTSAIESGDRRISTYERLVGLLYRQNRFAEAQQVLEEMGRGAFSSQRLESLALAVAVQQDQRQRAVELARQSVAERPDDAMRRIWLAEMLQLTDRRPEAIATLQKAVELAPKDIRPWNAVFMYHLRGGDKTKAEKTLTEITKQVPLEPAQKAFVLAQGYEMLGKRDDAIAQYRQASELAPKDTAVLGRLATLQLHDDVDAAEASLRKIVELAPENARARQALATLLALRDRDGAWDEAQELLRQAATGGAPLPADDRLRAVLLVRRGGDKQRRTEQHAEARRILETRVNGNDSPAAADRVLLAGVYESEARLLDDPAKLKAAHDQLWTLVDVAEPTESHLSLCADFIVRHARADGGESLLATDDAMRDQFVKNAEVCVDKLEAAQRKAKRYPNARTMALRARLMKLQDANADLASFIEPLAEQRLAALDKEPEQDQWALEVGNLYMSVALHDAAERWYRRLWPRVSQAYIPLVQCLAARDQFGAAIEVCQQAAKADPTSSRPALVLASVLSAGKPTADDLAQAEPMIGEAVKQHADDAELLYAVAVLRTIHGKPAEAIALFEAVVKLAPKHLLALNNVATLLAEQPDRRNDALRYIEQAIEVVGRKPALLDTQGTIHLMAGDYEAAVKCLEDAVDSEAVDPRYPFHLAAAYLKVGRHDDAREAFEKAQQNGLAEQVLTAGDLELKALLEKSL